MNMIKSFNLYVDENYASYFEQEKKKIIEKIKRIITKYNLEYFLISNEIEIDKDLTYFVDSFNKRDNDIFINFELYFQNHFTENDSKKVENLSPILLMKIWDFVEEKGFTNPDYILETLQGANIDAFKAVLNKTKNEINFNPWIFELFWEAGNEKELDKLDFQNILFKTHPEAVESFLEAGSKILPSIIKKYPNIEERIENYNMKKNSKKYNL